jgi:hypothetical protein
MKFIVIGQIGSDAGYWEFVDGHWVHVGGWAPEAVQEFSRAVNIAAQTAALKTPGLADAASRSLMEFAQKAISAHVKGAGPTVVILQLGQ